jgi:V/A-type H+-transporting ATPase subunit E
MAEELQSLLERINQEGVMKAEAEKAGIIADARKEAAEIITEAEKNAAAIIAEAEKNAAEIKERTLSALEQSRRDILLQLRKELSSRLHESILDASAAALAPEFMAQLVKELALAFAAAPDSVITVRASVKEAAALDQALRCALADSFAKTPQVFPGKEIKGGMEVSFDGGKCFYDFTLDAVSDLMDEYTGETFAGIFKAQ